MNEIETMKKIGRITRVLYDQFKEEEEYTYIQLVHRILNELDRLIGGNSFYKFSAYWYLVENIKQDDKNDDQRQIIEKLTYEMNKIVRDVKKDLYAYIKPELS